MSKGFIIHADSWRVAIATMESANRKTGNMVQLWILSRRENPVEAVAKGTDVRVCGDCPLRGDRGKERGCYVNLGQAPLAVWRSWEAGTYPKLDHAGLTRVFRGREIRFGAYGDPVHVPLGKLSTIAGNCDGFTGYTHQWRNPALRGYRRLIMASVESMDDARKAWSLGWRTFRIGERGSRDEVLCPSGRGIECRECQLCSGTSRKAKSVWIPAHGTGKAYIQEAHR